MEGFLNRKVESLPIKLYSLQVKPCAIIERVNRFTVRIRLEDNEEHAHLTNTGRLKEYIENGKKGLVVRINGPKLKYRLIGVEHDNYYAIIDTITQNKAFTYAVNMGYISRFRECRVLKTNPKILGSTLDYILECKEKVFYVETKSAVLRGEDDEAMYPDCPSNRGRRHIETLIRLSNMGKDPFLIFIAGFPGARCIRPFEEGDPYIANLMAEAYKFGVKIMGISLYLDGSGYIFLENDNLPLCRKWLEDIKVKDNTIGTEKS